MPLHRRRMNQWLAALPALASSPLSWAQGRKDSAVLGLVLEPPMLDPTTGAAAAIGEVVHLNILEGLTKIAADGAVTPLLAESWSNSGDEKRWGFVLRQGVTFSDGKPFDAQAVKFSFERARAPGSVNKAKKALWDLIANIEVLGPHNLVIELKQADALLPFRLGENTAVILHPDSAAQAATKPVGTGPYKLESWTRGASITLAKWDGHRNAAQVALKRVVFRVIDEPAAQVAALLAGDVDAFPRFSALSALKQLRADKRFEVQVGASAGKGLLAINNKRKPLNDVRVRRAIAAAIDRKAFIDAVEEGLGTPIGSHFAPTDIGFQDLTKVNAYDPAKARALLKEAGITTPLKLTLTLPPPAYARKGGELVAAQLAQVGIQCKLENVEWAQWLNGAFKGQFDLTLIVHVEPLDYATAYADPNYYFGYDSPTFRDYVAKLAATEDYKEKGRLWRGIQTQLAVDSVNAWIWNPAVVTVAKRGLRGLWASAPIAVNDLAALSWAPPPAKL